MKNLSITVTEQEFESRLASQQTLCVSTCPEWGLTTKVNELKWKLLACILLEFSGRITQCLQEKIEKLEISTGYCEIEIFWKSLRKCSACTSIIGLWEPEVPSPHAQRWATRAQAGSVASPALALLWSQPLYVKYGHWCFPWWDCMFRLEAQTWRQEYIGCLPTGST